MRLAQARITGAQGRASRCTDPSPLHRELAYAIDDHDRYRELQEQYGSLLQPDVAQIYGSLADAAASRAQILSDQITAATGANHAAVVNEWRSNAGRRIY